MVKDYKDYIEGIHAELPDVPREVIEEILRKGVSRLQDLINRDFDVQLACNKSENQYHLYLVRPKTDKFDRWDRALKRLRKITKLRESYEKGSK